MNYDNDRLPVGVLLYLLPTVVLPIDMLIFPVELVSIAKHAALYSYLGGVLIVAGAVGVICLLIQRYPGKTLVEISHQILGRFLGAALVLLYLGYWLINGAKVLRGMGEMAHATLLPFTPVWVVMLYVALASGYLALYGFEPVGRLVRLVTPLILCVVTVFFVAATLAGDIIRAIPFIKPNEVGAMLSGAWHSSHAFEQISTLLVFGAFAYPSTRVLAAVFTGLGLSGLMFLFSVTATIAVLGVGGTNMYHMPAVVAIQNIRIPTFLVEKIDFLFLAIWVAFSYLSIVLLQVAAGILVTRQFGVKSSFWSIIGAGSTQFTLAFIPRNFEHYIYLNDLLHRFVYGPIMLGFPFLLLVVSYLRDKWVLTKRRYVGVHRENS